jgi:hypothetical protein
MRMSKKAQYRKEKLSKVVSQAKPDFNWLGCIHFKSCIQREYLKPKIETNIVFL